MWRMHICVRTYIRGTCICVHVCQYLVHAYLCMFSQTWKIHTWKIHICWTHKKTYHIVYCSSSSSAERAVYYIADLRKEPYMIYCCIFTYLWGARRISTCCLAHRAFVWKEPYMIGPSGLFYEKALTKRSLYDILWSLHICGAQEISQYGGVLIGLFCKRDL